MTAKEAKEKAIWCSVSPLLRNCIVDAVNKGHVYLTLSEGITLHIKDQHALQELGYYIYFNKAFNSHEIRW